MSRKSEIAFYACENAIGHETAHLDPDDQIATYEALIRSWKSTIKEIRDESPTLETVVLCDCKSECVGPDTTAKRCRAEEGKLETKADLSEHKTDLTERKYVRRERCPHGVSELNRCNKCD